MKVFVVFAFAFPIVAEIGVVRGERQEAAAVVAPGAEVSVLGVAIAGAAARPALDRRDLELVAIELESAAKDRVLARELGPRARRAPCGRASPRYLDSDLNLSWRLQQLTALRVRSDRYVLKLTLRDFSDYPFIYMRAADEGCAPQAGAR